MAEGLAQKWLTEHNHEGWLAVSAGIYAIDGMSTSSETIQALASRGVTYDGTSTFFTEEMAKAATVVLCMSESHLTVATQYTNRAELLDPNGNISDPIGKGQAVYDALADQMEKLIAAKMNSLIDQGA
jgi:protein-tyrosine-phosphatase